MREHSERDAGTPPHAPQRLALWLSDIEGSTRLLEAHGEAYIAALQAHRLDARRACEAAGGRLVEDARRTRCSQCSPDAHAALDCASRLRECWEVPVADIPLRVRFGLHFGELFAP